jgi:hypothetical protein
MRVTRADQSLKAGVAERLVVRDEQPGGKTGDLLSREHDVAHEETQRLRCLGRPHEAGILDR